MTNAMTRMAAAAAVALGLCASTGAQAQNPAERCKPVETPGQWSKPGNDASRCYEVNQTFGGTSFEKDNNIWTYGKEFADLFGMPSRHIEGLKGADAAAFRIEELGYQRCGMGGNLNACQRLDICTIELYFDESKTDLPWAGSTQTQWVPRYNSLRWLRSQDSKERPYGLNAIEPANGVERLAEWGEQLIAFADPQTRKQAIFTSNIGTDQGGDLYGADRLYVDGYFRHFYKNMSMVSLWAGCFISARKTIAIRLELQEVRHQTTKRYLTVVLPEGFVSRIHEMNKVRKERASAFNKSLFAPPIGTKGTAPSATPTVQ